MMMNNSLAAMPLPQLKRAIAIREQIDALTMELNELMVTSFNGTNGLHSSKQRLSASGRARIAAAQHLRWSAFHRATTGNGHSNGNGAHLMDKKERLSAEGRAKVSAAVKARWERFRAAKARALRAK
jgi:hypothetical protein